MPLPPPPTPIDCPFEYAPFVPLFDQALRDVADRRIGDTERKAAARVLAYLLTERLVTEAVATDILVAIRKSLDVSKVVRTLLLGLRHALGDYEKITEWTMRIAGRAHAERHVESFVSAMRILVSLRDFDGGMPTNWQLSLIRALEMPDLQRRLYLLADDYASRFCSDPRWVNTIRARRIIEASGGSGGKHPETCPSNEGDAR